MPGKEYNGKCPACENTNSVFVFGSNFRGKHGKFAALHAKQFHGARENWGDGRQGSSYGIPTKDSKLKILDLQRIAIYVAGFIVYAKLYPGEMFHVTAIGTGAAGYPHSVMANLFKGSPDNCIFDPRWREFLGESRRYW